MNGYFNIYELIPRELSLNDNTEIMVNNAYSIIERYFNLNKVPYFRTDLVRASGSISKNDVGYAISMLLDNKQLIIEVTKDSPNILYCKIVTGGSSDSGNNLLKVSDGLAAAFAQAFDDVMQTAEYDGAYYEMENMFNSDKLFYISVTTTSGKTIGPVTIEEGLDVFTIKTPIGDFSSTRLFASEIGYTP